MVMFWMYWLIYNLLLKLISPDSFYFLMAIEKVKITFVGSHYISLLITSRSHVKYGQRKIGTG